MSYHLDKEDEHAEEGEQVESQRRRALKDAENKVRIGTIWAIQYWRELFNFRFDKYLIIQVIPGVYGLALAGIIFGLLYLTLEAFLQSTWRGLFYLLVGTPFSFLLLASTLRALLEFYMVTFRIAEDVDELAGIRDTVVRLDGVSETVDEMASITRGLSLWKLLTGDKKPGPDNG